VSDPTPRSEAEQALHAAKRAHRVCQIAFVFALVVFVFNLLHVIGVI
jgi:hypothetical protein